MGMRREAGRLVRQGARAKKMPPMPFTPLSEGLSLFRATTTFCHSPLTSPATKVLKSSSFSGCKILRVRSCILLLTTLAQQPEQALSKRPSSVPMTKSKLNLQWVCNRESTQDRTRCWKRFNTLSRVPVGMCHTAIGPRGAALSCHQREADSRQPSVPFAGRGRKREERAAPPWQC